MPPPLFVGEMVRLCGFNHPGLDGKLARVASKDPSSGKATVEMIDEKDTRTPTTKKQAMACKPDNLVHACLRCHVAATGGNVRKTTCTTCKTAHYCSSGCSQQDASRHVEQQECAAFVQAQAKAHAAVLSALGGGRDGWFTALRRGNLDTVRIYVETHGVDIDELVGEPALPPLVHAALHNNLPVVRYLVERGADVEKRIVAGKTAMHGLAEHNRVEVMRYLLEVGAQVDATDDDKDTPLHRAASCGHLDAVKLLLQHGAVVDCLNTSQHTPLLCAVLHNYEAIAKYLVEHGAKTLMKTAVCHAAHCGHLAIVTHLLAHAPDGAEYLDDALHLAALKDQLPVVEYLLQQQQQRQRRVFGGVGLIVPIQTLFVVTERGHARVVAAILRHAMMTKVDLSYLRDGVALLHVASHNGHLPIVQLLVERGADKNQVATQSGFTPLLHALAQKALPVAQYLLEQGADPHQAGGDGEGLTPLHLTAREGMVDQVGYFLRAPGSNVDVATTETGMTALHLASFRGHLPVVRLLLEKGADKDLGSGKVGGTAMFWAVVGRHMDVLMHLLEVAQVDPHKVRPGGLFLPAMIGVGRCSHRS